MPLPHDIEAGFPVNIPGSSGSIHQQSELPQNAEAGQPQSLHDGLYSAILNYRQGPRARPGYEFYTSHDIEKIAVQGFPSIAAFHAKYPNTRSCRGFGYLNQMLMSRYQGQLTCLLGELVKLDTEEAREIASASGGNFCLKAPFDKEQFISRCRRSPDQGILVQAPNEAEDEEDEGAKRHKIDAMRENLVANAERILSNYCNRINWVGEQRKFPRPSRKTHEDLFRRIQSMGDLEPDVLDYLRASDDFIYADADPLYERFHALLVSSRNVILRVLRFLYLDRLLPAGYTPFARRSYRARRIRLVVKGVMILFNSTFLIPIGVLYLDTPNKYLSFFIVVLFDLIFAFTLVALGNRMSHVLLGLAAYSAVLTTFLSISN